MLHQIVLRLARNPGYPDGDAGQGYVLVAPLDRNGRLDQKTWRRQRHVCTVVRFRPGAERDAAGVLEHGSSQWSFDHEKRNSADDEPVYRLGDHQLVLGDYVTIHESDGKVLTHRVAESRPWKTTERRSEPAMGTA